MTCIMLNLHNIFKASVPWIQRKDCSYFEYLDPFSCFYILALQILALVGYTVSSFMFYSIAPFVLKVNLLFVSTLDCILSYHVEYMTFLIWFAMFRSSKYESCREGMGHLTMKLKINNSTLYLIWSILPTVEWSDTV